MKFRLWPVLLVILLLGFAGTAFAKPPWAGDTRHPKKEVALRGTLERAGTPGYDFVLDTATAGKVLLVPANSAVAAKCEKLLGRVVVVQGKELSESTPERRVMGVHAVRPGWSAVGPGLEPRGVPEAVYGGGSEAPAEFSDVGPQHWARQAIREMARKGILHGVGAGRFEPEGLVTRAQFAKMLVLALAIPVDEAVYERTFADVTPEDWFYRYVETASPYLTGFRAGDQLLFRPHLSAVREDMAVAIAKAHGLAPADPSVLSQFTDHERISEALRPYVAAVVQAGLMKGYPDGTFRALGTLTRAEAAVLLYRVMQAEKVVVEP
ncbi:MAG: S-layer homology domain-containing protein [Desulfotomaculales bacterium]